MRQSFAQIKYEAATRKTRLLLGPHQCGLAGQIVQSQTCPVHSIPATYRRRAGPVSCLLKASKDLAICWRHLLSEARGRFLRVFELDTRDVGRLWNVSIRRPIKRNVCPARPSF